MRHFLCDYLKIMVFLWFPLNIQPPRKLPTKQRERLSFGFPSNTVFLLVSPQHAPHPKKGTVPTHSQKKTSVPSGFGCSWVALSAFGFEVVADFPMYRLFRATTPLPVHNVCEDVKWEAPENRSSAEILGPPVVPFSPFFFGGGLPY